MAVGRQAAAAGGPVHHRTGAGGWGPPETSGRRPRRKRWEGPECSDCGAGANGVPPVADSLPAIAECWAVEIMLKKTEKFKRGVYNYI